ncbi:hypothetical protein [Rhizobium lusitanum]|uniref:hypothetical protein n=1 Tax=Rhizobium lusitanum TaxID=293958 RepID=UPI001958DAF7|nr:hypothetical protein [Rhizobium lusitanum]MBM7045444.1 hypothetical protein [Rhizobium lusitanum]
MPSIKVNKVAEPTESQRIVEEGNKHYSTTDALGREIVFRRLTGSDQRRMLKAISNESANKEKLLGMYMLAACVVSIDGDPISLPKTELQADFLVDRLETHGFEALGAAVKKEFGVTTEEDLRDDAGE